MRLRPRLGPAAALLLALVGLLAAAGGVRAALDEAPTLLAFKASVSGTSDALSSWVNGTDPCDPAAPWLGLTCTAGRVTEILLSGSGLSGTLPPALNLSAVATLDLVDNELDGSLPPSLAVPSLRRLLLEGNQLTGALPEAWPGGFPALSELSLQGNKLAGTLPPGWTEPAGFAPNFTAALQPGNPLLCGDVPAAPGRTLLYSAPPDAATGERQTHVIVTTLGSCAQDGSCGGATVNASAPNLYDLAWANRAAVLDVERFNPTVQENGEPKQGSPVVLPCYPAFPPTFFGSDAARGKATWQAGTDGNRSSWLPVSGNRQPQPATECSQTAQAPGYWMVDLQEDTGVMGVLVRAGALQMEGVEVRVSEDPTPDSGALCKGADSYDPGEGKIILCQRVLQGRYVSISAQSKVSLCVVEVYPLVGNAALGKATNASAGSGDSPQTSQVVNGNMANTACATVVSGPDLAAWITVDLGYAAPVETVVVQNGYSTFSNDLYVRLGNASVVAGNENPVCSQGQSLSARSTLPIQCTGPDGQPAVGRFLTLYRKINQASDMYICQVLAFLAAGPDRFYQSPPAPPAPPLSPPPAPPPPAPVGSVEVTVGPATTAMSVAMQLSGPGLAPLDQTVRDSVVRACAATWEGSYSMADVRGLRFAPDPAGGAVAEQSAAPGGAGGRALLQLGQDGSVLALLGVSVAAGQAPDAADFVVASGYPGGSLQDELANEGLVGVVPTLTSISELGLPPPPASPLAPAPAPAPVEAEPSSGSSTPVGAIVGGVVGGLAAVAAAAAALLYVRRRRRPGAPPKPLGGSTDGSDSPKTLGAMEAGRGSPTLLGLPKVGDSNGFTVAVAAAGGAVAASGAPHRLELDGAAVARGPPAEVMSFLADDSRSDHSAMGTGAGPPSEGGPGEGAPSGGVARTSSDGGLGGLAKQKSLASRMDSGVSELWTVDLRELEIQKQIGEGSFGKVYLAKWRETTVAVKVLGAMGGGAAPGLDDEFPETAGAGRGHPLYASLQREAAMMASLRHPAIVMYLGVCLDPPAVVTEYCARGSLNDVLKRARSSPLLAAQLDWARRLHMALDAAKGMLYLHSCSPPIIHRDLKSANLLVDRHWRVRVCDFNLSRVMEDSAVLSSVAATNPRWLAPEILSGKGYTFASDVYSFGICMWEVLTWQVPYHEYGPWQVVAMVTESAKRPEVPPPEELPTPGFGGGDEYVALMRECWAQAPADRPTFATVISRLRRMLALETSLRRESPTKVPRGLSSLSTGAGGSVGAGLGGSGAGGDDTPMSRSRLASLAGGSDLCLSPERRSTLGDESDSDTLGLSASPLALSALAPVGSSSPPKPPRHPAGAGSARQLVPGGDANAAAEATAPGSSRRGDGGEQAAG